MPAPRRTRNTRFARPPAHVQSERLALAQLPIEAPIGKGTAEELQLTLERTVLNLRPGQFVALTGERADLPGVKASEIVTLKEIQHSGGFTTLFFESPGLTLRYVRDTVVLNANVAPATHGETVAEVLGSGDGAAHLSALHAQTAAAHLHRLVVGKRRAEFAAGPRRSPVVGRIGSADRSGALERELHRPHRRRRKGERDLRRWRAWRAAAERRRERHGDLPDAASARPAWWAPIGSR